MRRSFLATLVTVFRYKLALGTRRQTALHGQSLLNGSQFSDWFVIIAVQLLEVNDDFSEGRNIASPSGIACRLC